PDFLADARAATYYFGQLSARKTALEYVRRLEGSNPGKFEARHVPKLVALTLKAGWGLDVSFTASTKNSLVFDVKKCHLCEGVSSDSPFCDKFVSGVVVGVLSVCLKTKVDCFEITCRAMGADRCSFKATIL
ncbi:MAG: V4R domain-containing protein, partial [Candidatus Caldarchaeum sp.]